MWRVGATSWFEAEAEAVAEFEMAQASKLVEDSLVATFIEEYI